MDEFELRKREALQPVYFEAGAALFDCQPFEYAIAYLLYLFSRLGTQGLDTGTTVAILENEEKKTVGQLIVMLRKHLKVSEGVEESLQDALAARNLIIHRYFTDNLERMAQPDEHATLVREIRNQRKKVRDCTQLLDPFVKGLAEGLDGFSFSKFEAEIKRGFMP